MSTSLRGLARRVGGEPLTHFVLLGIGLFGLHRAVAPARADANTVVVTREAEAWLVANFEQRQGRAPTPDERDALIGRHVDEEVLYREGLALGLDRSDPIVRRRVVQRMQLLLEDLAQPSPEELRHFFEAHADAYAGPETFGLEHAYFAGVDGREQAKALRAALADGASLDGRGQPFPQGRVLRGRTRAQLEAVFGASFARAVVETSDDGWFVVQSSLGWHVVRVTRRAAGEMPELARVRARVLEDWRRARRSASSAEAVASLRARYRVDREVTR